MEAVVSDPSKPLSALIRERRRAAGLTQRQLADAAQVSIGVLRDLEQGVTAHPRAQVVESLATALRLEPSAAQPAKPASSGQPMVAVRLQVLGPLAAWRDGAALALGPASQQAVLGLLALSPNTPLHRNRISEALWDDEPPPSASTMIQSYVSRLRRILDPGRPAQARDGLLVSTTTGYQLQVAEGQLDHMHFLRLTRQARSAQIAGQAAAACAAYEQALGLWHGEPLQDLEILRSHPAIADLARQRDSAIMEFAEAASQLGAHNRVLTHLAELTQRDPLNERAHARYMIALAGTGQQAAALEVFEQLRHRLGDELGLRPGPELNQAQQQVLRQHVSFAPPAAPGRTTDAPPVCQLPPAVADFTGRETEIAQLTDMLSADEKRRLGVPIAMISGLPGVGKTALALRIAHKIRSAFPDGQLWAQLDGATQHPRDPGDVLGELLRALGVHGSAIPKSSAERASLYRSRLAGRRVLVLADDAASADQVRPLLPGTRESAVLITSRTGLAGPAGSRIIQLDPLTQAEAVQLLTWIVGEKRVTAEPQAAHELAAACGQLPLAVRIAGAKLATRTSWQLSVLAGKIANERRRLDELEAGDMSVRASLSQSYQTLDEPAQRAFRLLASLGPAEVPEWVVAALIDQPDAANVVGQLTDKSLLTPVGMDGTGQPRYRLHDLLRDYAAEQLANEPHALQDAAIERTMNGWLQLTALADAGLPREPYFPQPAEHPPTAVVPDALAKDLTTNPVAWFTAERLNLLAAIERCCSSGGHHAAAQLGSYLASFQYLQGRWDDAERIWGLVTAVSPQDPEDATEIVHAQLRLAVATCYQGRHAEAKPIVEQCAASLEGLADESILGVALYWRAVCEWNVGRFADARDSATRALQLSKVTNNLQAEAMALRMLALSQMSLPDHRKDAAASAERALALTRVIGHPMNELEVMHSLAVVYNWTGRHQAALEVCQDGLHLARRLKVPASEADWLAVLGEAYHGLGRYSNAVESWSRALPIFQHHFRHRMQALCLMKLGYAYQAMGGHQNASMYLNESLIIFEDLQLSHYIQRVRDAIVDCQQGAAGDLERSG